MFAQKGGDEVVETLNESGIDIVEALDQESRVGFLTFGDQRSNDRDTEGLPNHPTKVEQGCRRRPLLRCNIARRVKHGRDQKQSLAEADDDHAQTKVGGLPGGCDPAGKKGPDGKQRQAQRQGHAGFTA